MPAIRSLSLCVLLLPVALSAAEVDPSHASVQSREVLNDGRLFKATIKIARAGKYLVVAGYAKDTEGEFKFLKGKLSGTKYYEIRKIEADRNNVTVELSFPIKAVPPLVKALKRVAIFLSEEDIPTASP